jgi:hypothetical protein
LSRGIHSKHKDTIMKKLANKSWVATGAAVALLAACGGGGGGDGGGGGGGGFVAGTDVPVGAEKNVGDVIAFARQQIAATSDSTEPVVLGDAKLATDDAADPVDL